MKTALNLLCILIIICAPFSICPAQDETYKEVKRIVLSKAFGKSVSWQAVAYQAGDPPNTEKPALLCFVKDGVEPARWCFKAQSAQSMTSDYSFQTVSSLYVTTLYDRREPLQGLIFISNYLGGGSGSLSLATIWVYDEDNEAFTNILPPDAIYTEQGDGRLVHINPHVPAFIIAKCDWSKGEKHFDPHQYWLSIYKYNELLNKFQLVKEIRTRRKYDRSGDPKMDDVIKNELTNIRLSNTEIGNWELNFLGTSNREFNDIKRYAKYISKVKETTYQSHNHVKGNGKSAFLTAGRLIGEI
jgi:hypothetical protein